MPRSKRKEREILRVKADILDAAARVFARVGYDGATMQEIAREAGYSAPSLYAYFQGKEAILVALSEGFLKDVLAVFDEPLPRGLTLEQSLELLMRRLLELCDERRSALVVFFNFMTLREPLPRRDSQVEGQTYGGALVIDRATRWLSDAAAEGELGEHTPEDAADLMFGIVYAFFVRWLRSNTDGRLTDLLPLTIDLFLHGVHGPKKHS